MDSSGLWPGIAFVVSIGAFIFVDALQSSYYRESAKDVEHPALSTTGIMLWGISTGSVLATTASILAIYRTFADYTLAWIVGCVIVTLLLLWTIHSITLSVIANHRWAPYSVALRRLLARSLKKQRESSSVKRAARESDEHQERVIHQEMKQGLDDRERGMISSILSLDHFTAKEIMVPRVDIIAVDAETPLPEVASVMVEEGHTKLPVFKENIDQIEGVIHSTDLLEVLSKGTKNVPLEGLLRPVIFVPESKDIAGLLEELQEKKIQIALIVDEYGGIEGLVTMEDILEEIVGEIEDAFTRDEPRITIIDEQEAMVDGRLSLDEVNETLDASIQRDNVDTIGGLLYSVLDRMPVVGDVIKINNLKISVVSTRGRRVRQLRIINQAER
mgnify:CR=1 FL=1